MLQSGQGGRAGCVRPSGRQDRRRVPSGPPLAPVGGLLLAACLLLAASLTGCGHHRSHAGRTADGRLILRFWNGFTGPDGKTMEALVARFGRVHPEIEVRMQIIPWGTYY